MSRSKKILAAVLLAIAASARADDIPGFVAAQARELESAGAAVTPSSGWPDVLHEYAASFLQGFLRPDDEYRTTSPVVRRAWAAGQAYRHEHPAQFEAILHGYGYARVEADGTWLHNWETSRFVPDGRHGQSWYISPLGSRSWAQLGWNGAPPDDGWSSGRAHVAGWLSRPTSWRSAVDGDDRFLMATTLMRALPAACIEAPALGRGAPITDFACP